MPKTDPATPLDDYAPVADRVALFYSRHPTGRIITELVSQMNSEVVFKASIFRSVEETEPAATGWAAEREGDGDINTVACLENTETSAVGRALANLGLTASRRRPSLEEIQKAERARMRLLAGEGRAKPLPGAVRPQVREREPVPFDTPRQKLADRVLEVFDLISEAERAGLAARRAESIRARLGTEDVEATVVDDAARALRGWLARQTDRALGTGASPPRQRRVSGSDVRSSNDPVPSSSEGSA